MTKKEAFNHIGMYAKFPSEMEYFYWREDDEGQSCDLSWLKEDERGDFIGRVERLYEVAFQELMEIYRQVGDVLNDRLKTYINLKKASPRTTELCRDVYWNVSRKKGKTSQKFNCQIGYYFSNIEGSYCAAPWIWMRGGKSKEAALKAIIGKGGRRGSDDGFSTGSVVLGQKWIKMIEILREPEKTITLLTKPFVSLDKKAWEGILDLGYPRGVAGTKRE